MILDYLITTGQAAAAMLLVYGGVLALGAVMPLQRKSRALNPALEDELLLLKHIHNDA